METRANGDYMCPCGSGKKYADCCLQRDLGHRLNLKGKRAEQFVYNLSKKSFFSDWCFPNPKLPNGKEICDLLVVYDDIAIIWQIKDLKTDENHKYKTSEVKKNMHQLSTARHRLFELNVPIDLVNPKRRIEKFDPKSIKDVYLISALLGKSEDYYSALTIVDGKIIHTFTREFIINRVHTCGKEYERVARELARTNRFERRCLSKAFFEAHVKAHYEQKKNTFRSILKNRNSTYCFVFMDDPEPRTVRKALLASSCFVARGIIKENTTVLGIATEKTMKPTCTYDFCLMEIPTWGEQQQKEMDRLQKEIGIFSSYNQRHVSEDEYPSPFA